MEHMQRPDSLKKLMQKDHDARAYVNWLEKRIREFDRIEKETSELKERVSELERKYEEMEGRVQAAPVWKPGKKHKSGKGPGRPEGHEGSTRPLPEHADETVELKTDACPQCGTRLTGNAAETRERLVEDIEPARPKTRKYVIRRRWCPHCRRIVSEKPADVIPKCRLGLNVLLFVSFYRYVLAMPMNKICTVLLEYYGIHISAATVVNELNLLAKAFGGDFAGIMDGMRHEHSVHGDETGRRINGENHWLWAFITKTKALYLVRKSRGSCVPREVLGADFSGVLTSDFWNAYNWVSNQQKCWAHILRKTAGMESDRHLHRRLRRLYRAAARLRDSGIGMEEKKRRVERFEAEVYGLKFSCFNSPQAGAFARTLAKHRGSLFRFVTDVEVEPTNNAAERAIRPAVVMRKISGGDRSERGARTFETNMSVIQTWRLQDKNFFEEGMKRLKEFSGS